MMTDEELRKAAKESWWTNSEVSGSSVPVDIYTTGYMNGAKAMLEGTKRHAVVWHDLRKNPNDLPKNPRNLPIDNFLNDEGIPVWYESISGTWHYTSDNMLCDNVIAWCEIPMFDEE